MRTLTEDVGNEVHVNQYIFCVCYQKSFLDFAMQAGQL
jgi:hypothetical protein